MNTMIVMYNLAEGQNEAEFETWLREIDMPGYTKLKSMRNPTYYRASTLLGEDAPAPFKYFVTIEMDSADAVELEMAAPAWEGFVADFESRTVDHAFVVAQHIIPSLSEEARND